MTIKEKLNIKRPSTTENKPLNIKFNEWKTHFIKIFPYFSIEFAAVVFVLTFIGSGINVSKTATISQESMFLYNQQNSYFDIDKNDNDTDQQFEISQNGDQEETTNMQQDDYCFVGGKQFIDTQNAVFTGAQFVAKEDADVNWLMETAIPKIKELNKKLYVVSLGTNDMANANKYITALNQIADEQKDKIFIFATLPPVKESDEQPIKNAQIQEFNKKIADGLNDHWQILDQYKYLSETVFASGEIAYDDQVSTNVFAWMIKLTENQVKK